MRQPVLRHAPPPLPVRATSPTDDSRRLGTGRAPTQAGRHLRPGPDRPAAGLKRGSTGRGEANPFVPAARRLLLATGPRPRAAWTDRDWTSVREDHAHPSAAREIPVTTDAPPVEDIEA